VKISRKSVRQTNNDDYIFSLAEVKKSYTGQSSYSDNMLLQFATNFDLNLAALLNQSFKKTADTVTSVVIFQLQLQLYFLVSAILFQLPYYYSYRYSSVSINCTNSERKRCNKVSSHRKPPMIQCMQFASAENRSHKIK